MGRKELILTFSIFLLGVSGCEKNGSETKTQAVKPSPSATAKPVTAPSIPKDGNYDAKGEVTKINLEGGSIEIKHEDIKDLMAPMQMEFFVKEKALLKGLAVGDKIDFVIEYKHPTEIITSIKKTQ
jgi:Cu(I)/Ag(I) efflux system periplasmic protein CusF